MRLTLKNYRCFVAPVTVEFRPGFTAFVGINNAGKSALIRFFVEFRHLFALIQSPGNLQNGLLRSDSTFELRHVLDSDEPFSNLNEDPIELLIEFFPENFQDPLTVKQVVFHIERSLRWSAKAIDQNGLITFDAPFEWSDAIALSQKRARADFGPLMNLAALLTNTLYVGPFRNIINVGAKTNYFDIQIGDAFVAQFRELKTGPNKRASMGIQRLIDDIKRIFEFNSLAIDPSHDNQSLHITVNGKPFKQHELGSGLSQFIIVLANIAIRRPSLVLIDEPELNLHPRLQLDFLTALGSYAKFGVWFSTHSLGLARSSAERLYTVRRIADGNSTVVPIEGTPRLAELLGELSFSTQRELGADKILLVEGPTEVKVVQQLLRRKGKDHKVLILSMHGHLPDEVELDEILRITPDISALIDSEKESAESELEFKRKSFVDMFHNKGLKVHVLERRATENYFTDVAVKEVFGDSYHALAPFQKLKDVSPRWGKAQNWQLVPESAAEIDHTDLGRFLDDI